MKNLLELEKECFVDFRERLAEQLKDPEIRKGFEIERHKVRLEAMLNTLLRETGNENFCVEVMDIDEY
jgi:hypothetical protein